MKTKTLRGILICLLLLCTPYFASCEQHRADWVKEVERLEREASVRICRELNVEQTMSGGSLMGGLNHVSLGFDAEAEWTRDQARRNVLLAMDIIIASLNSSAEVRAHSKADPIGPEQVEISFFYRLPANEGAGPTGIAETVHNNEISYISLPGSGKRREILHQETIEEARALVRVSK